MLFMVSLPLLFTPSSSPADGGAAKVSPFRLYWLSSLRSPSHGQYSTPLSLLCNSSLDASDYRGELRFNRPLAKARGAQVRQYSPGLPRLLFQMFRMQTPQCRLLPEVCLHTRQPPPLNCRRELSQRTLQTLSVIPQTGETSSLSLCSHVKKAIWPCGHCTCSSEVSNGGDTGIGASEDQGIVNCSSPFWVQRMWSQSSLYCGLKGTAVQNTAFQTTTYCY